MADEGTTTLITGASGGIGLEMARILAERGDDLVLVSRRHEPLARAAEELRSRHGVEVHVLAADLAEPGAAARVFAFTEAEGLSIGRLINNAGVGLFGEHLSLDVGAANAMLQLNINALCELCLLYGQQMRARGSGQILNVASTAAYQPTPFFAAYGASKSFVLNFSEALAKELETEGVSVSCLSPGPTDTSFFANLDERGIENGHFQASSRHDARRVAEVGVALMLAGRLSKIVGTVNTLRAFSGRLAPRRVVAAVSKRLMQPKRGSVTWAPSRSEQRRSAASRP